MPINKGLISDAVWRIIAMSVQLDEFYCRTGYNDNLLSFFRLKDEEPQAANAVEAVLRNTKWRQANLYSIEIGEQIYTMVSGSNSLSRQQELMYPERIEGVLEEALLGRATVDSERTLGGFLWQQEGGLFLYPILGLIAMAFGLNLPILMSDVSSQSVPEVIHWATIILGIGCIVGPFVFGWWKRNRLRSALKKLSFDWAEKELENLRAREKSLV